MALSDYISNQGMEVLPIHITSLSVINYCELGFIQAKLAISVSSLMFLKNLERSSIPEELWLSSCVQLRLKNNPPDHFESFFQFPFDCSTTNPDTDLALLIFCLEPDTYNMESCIFFHWIFTEEISLNRMQVRAEAELPGAWSFSNPISLCPSQLLS